MNLNLEHHPCFNDKTRHQYGRVHLPVAPQCNLQCNFCDRKYDCVNESRPGVSSAVLSPGQAMEYLNQILEKNSNLSVVGIAGPGDPFANAPETLETLKRVRAAYPQMLLCVASNGLALPPYLDEIAELNVTHVTVTVNAVNPEVGEKIYSWVKDKKRIYRGIEGAELLWERQKESIEGLKKRGVLVKVNTILIPGINDMHVEEVARSVKELGADILNLIPLYANPGTVFENVPEPDAATLHESRSRLGKILPQMAHCTRCRADAAGLLGAANSDEVFNMLKACSQLPQDPSQHRPYVAITSREGALVNQHLGEAPVVWIYEKRAGRYHFKEKRNTPAPGSGELRWQELADTLQDCRILLTNGIGHSPSAVLKASGLQVAETEGLVEENLTRLADGLSLRVIPKKKCGTSCSGNGMGCGA